MTRSPRRDYCAGSTLPRRSLSLFHARRDRVANPLDTASHSDRTLLTTGLCGSARLADVGGVPNLVPLVTRSKVRASCCGCSKPKKKKREKKNFGQAASSTTLFHPQRSTTSAISPSPSSCRAHSSLGPAPARAVSPASTARSGPTVAVDGGVLVSFVVSTAARSWRCSHCTCPPFLSTQMMPNTNLATGDIQSHFAKVDPKVGRQQRDPTRSPLPAPAAPPHSTHTLAGRQHDPRALRLQRVLAAGQLSGVRGQAGQGESHALTFGEAREPALRRSPLSRAPPPMT